MRRFFNISYISVHTASEEKEDTFHEKIQNTYNQIPVSDIKIILGDFNAKTGREEYKPIIGEHSKHNVSKNNVLKSY
jgi:endonuclease/exonuclease/phosphatase family metal-dependent hydrolase